ncbi:MAG: amino acid adenylation domain-containing protein [Myxococcales bacterium]|nr:amino acid adenylation domain-containing protein [Myxococcota bacterium]MDW8284054.1 amino acid adenylation domain-containing protein [Myxococcales bacterium]
MFDTAQDDAHALEARPPKGECEEVYAFPATSAQQRLWFLDQMDPGAATYNIPQALRLIGPLDIGALHRALRGLVERHEALRTTFAASENGVLQIVAPTLELPLPVTDLCHLPEGTRLQAALQLAAEEARRPFDLSRGPLLRVGLLVLGPADHVLLLNIHHIVCDGWSLGVLFRELGGLYRVQCGEAPALPEPAIQQADYAVWEVERLKSPELERQLDYWRKRLAGPLPHLELPADRRPAQRTSRGHCLRLRIEPALAEQLNLLARREGVSLFMLLLAAYQLWLSRLCGQNEVLVGSPVANRDRPELEAAVGFFTSTVVLRTDLSGDPPFVELLERVKEVVYGALACQEVPLDRIVQALHPDRTVGLSPLFQAMFALQRAPDSALDLPAVQVEPLEVHSGTAKFDVLLEVQEVGQALMCLFEYSTDLFEERTARRLLGYFVTLLQGIVQGPQRRLSELPLLTETERHQLIVQGTGISLPLPQVSVADLILTQARAAPERVAVESAGRHLSYGDLDRRSAQLAARLRAAGVGPNVLVGLYLERTPELLVALLGVLRAGGAYLPLDTAHPPDRITYILEDARAPVLLTEAALREALPAVGCRLVLVEEEGPAPDTWTDAQPGELAYTIYTSGSTGRPKGVQVPGRALLNFLLSMRREPGLGPEDRVLAVTTVSFDIAALELLLPLVVGGTVLLVDRDTASDGELLRRAIEDMRPTVMQATPATWRLLLEAGWRGGLRRALCGGEALPPALAEQLLPLVDELWNMYGPTETTVWSTCCRVTDPERIGLGRPIANTRIYLLDPHRQPVPDGVRGELYIGGAGVAHGYLNQPELTAERFLPDPFSPEPGARMYRTGDLCRRHPDGRIEYLGRNDHQVKVRGFRIELAEIEAALERHEAVREAVVVVRQDAPGDQRLVAYVVYGPQGGATPSELRSFLRKDLPDYMLPHLFVEMDRLPLGPSGKVDRRALPDPFGQAQRDDGYIPPRTPTEQLIARLFAEVLGVPRVGLHDNFFNLGGHSLLSVQLVHRIERETGRRLSPRALVFQNVGQIAAECDRAPTEQDQAERRDRSLLGALRDRLFNAGGEWT